MPEVVELTRERLALEAYIDVPELLPESGADDRILALYVYDDGANGTIHVLQCSNSEYESVFIDYASGEMCEQENLMFQERLLHELIHHIQTESEAEQRFTCRKFGEKGAYLLGGEFLKSHYFTHPSRSLDSLFNRSLIVHELVHYLQHVSGRYPDSGCERYVQREREAYAAQQQFFIAYGVMPGIQTHYFSCNKLNTGEVALAHGQ